MHTALDINIPNYASANVTAQEVVAAISALWTLGMSGNDRLTWVQADLGVWRMNPDGPGVFGSVKFYPNATKLVASSHPCTAEWSR
jgi:hypothetical protein